MAAGTAADFQATDPSRGVSCLVHVESAEAKLTYRLPLSLRGAQTVLEGRRQVEAVIKGDDDRLLVIVG